MCEFQYSLSCIAFYPSVQKCVRKEACVCVCKVLYVKTALALGAGTADSTRIICTLAHLGWTQGTHHHSTESPPSFLTGLETKKRVGERERKREREKVSGRVCSYTFSSWQRLCHNLAEIIEVLKLLPVSPSVSLPLCLCQFQTRCQFEEAERRRCTRAKRCLNKGKSSKMAHVKHAQCLTHLQMHAASPWEFDEFDT